MPRVLSQDLRERVVAAVDAGMSCRAAAARLGVSAASAIRWRQLVVQHGTPAAKPQGGDRRAARIDAHATVILHAIKTKDDITLVERQALLAERGTPVGIGTLWRFFDRHRITRKRRQRTPPSRTAPTS
jgi:transposase